MKKTCIKLAAVAIVAIILVVIVFLAACSSTEYVFQEYDWDSIAVSSQSDIYVEGKDEASGKTDTEYTLSKGDSIILTFNTDSADDLAIQLDYYVLHSGIRDTEISVQINGVVYGERYPLKAMWVNETEDFAVDSLGNEIVPTQTMIDSWQTVKLYAYDYSTVLPEVFPFNEGENTVIITSTGSGGDIMIRNVCAVSSVLPVSYEKYAKTYSGYSSGSGTTTIECEHFYSKNTTQVIPTYSADVNVTPYNTYNSLLNTASGMEESSQEVFYKINVDSSGLYKLSFQYENDNANRTVFLSFTIDGEAPFRELLSVPFVYNGKFSECILGGDEPYEIYLSEGEHIISIRIDSSLTSESYNMITEAIEELNDIYLDLKKIAGTIQDTNREWDPDSDYPGVVESLTEISAEIDTIVETLKTVNGSDANYQAIIYLQTAKNSIEGLLEDPSDIANNYTSISEGTGSIVQMLSNASSDIASTPISFDKIAVSPSDETSLLFEVKSGFTSIWEGIKKLCKSFTTDYSGTTDDDMTITVWVARSSQYVDLMQQLIDESDFEETTGYSVKFSILADESKLILSNAANISPNAVMGISNWLPYELGIRGLTVDLSEYDDYAEVISRFSDGAMISLIADELAYGLPETQDFYVLYYRTDIFEKYGFTVPDTWEDVIAMLPKLQRYGMNFYIPLSSSTSSKSIMTTAPFIYQYGGTLFSDDGTETTISDENSLNAIKMMTELYTLYGLPQQISDFFDSFRNGSLPIGISTFDTYLKLSTAAPEISGKWAIALSPGVADEDGEVQRWQTGSATAVTLLKSGDSAKDDAGWELLKWWTSAEVQTEFMNKLTMVYGKSYVWNSANLEAFQNSVAFSEEHIEVIMEQWEWMREIPRVPGWYMLERELSNAWNSIVIDGENVRSVVEDAVSTINKELQRKLEEFGYMKNGVMVNSYRVTTFDYIYELKRRN